MNLIRFYLLALQKHLKPVSVQDHYRGIKRFLNWLLEEDILNENPMARIPTPKALKQIVQPFSEDQIHRMLVVCGNTFAGCRDTAIVSTFVDTSLRLGELARIQLSDVDMGRGTIKVTGKGAKQRLVHIEIDTQKAILKYPARRDEKRREDIRKGKQRDHVCGQRKWDNWAIGINGDFRGHSPAL